MRAIPEDTTQVVRKGVERACRDFSQRLAPLGFARTRKMLWTRRFTHTVQFIHLHRSGSTYGKPMNYSVSLTVELDIRVLNDLFEARALNGPSSDDLRLGKTYHLRFNASTGSTYDRCIDDLTRFILQKGEPWFNRFRSAEALLIHKESPLREAEKERLRAALNGQYQPKVVAKSLVLLGIKETRSHA
jgi:hypothetical protein